MKNPSPLFVWKLVFIAVVIAGLFMHFNDPMKVVHQKRDEALDRRFSRIQFQKGETGIVFFGNSLLTQALPIREPLIDEELERELRKSDFENKSVSVRKIATGGITAWKLQDLSEKIIAARPSVIVIQSEMFVARRLNNPQPEPPPAKRVGNWSGVLNLELFGSTDGGKKPVKQFFATEQKQPDPAQTRQKKIAETLAAARELWSHQVVSINAPEFVVARQFVERASALGIQVVVVELPVSQTAAKLCSSEYLKDRRAAIQELTKSGVLHLVYTKLLPDDYFRDYSHLNRRGRREFMRWFSPLLFEELRKRGTIQ